MSSASTTATIEAHDESLGARAFDFALRFYPVPREERCASAVCRRLAFIYGNAIHHAAVDEATHEALHELFGVVVLDGHGHQDTFMGAASARDAFPAVLAHLERVGC